MPRVMSADYSASNGRLHTVQALYFGKVPQDVFLNAIRFMDFGNVTFVSEKRKELSTATPCRAPEFDFGDELGAPADI